MAGTCKAQTKSGKPCGMTPLPSGWCYSHDPALAEQRTAARVLGGQRRKRVAAPVDPSGIDISTLTGIQRVLAAAIGDALRLDNSAQRARVVAALTSVALTALERAGRQPPEDSSESYTALVREMLENCGLVPGEEQAEAPEPLLWRDAAVHDVAAPLLQL